MKVYEATEQEKTTREKLIELLMDSPGLTTCYGDREEFAENADYLIAHGVGLRERDCHWATEQAYKNGYEAGKRDAVKHGRWIDGFNVDHLGRITEHTIDCSACDCVFKDDSRAVVQHWKERFEACPFCGAIMDA